MINFKTEKEPKMNFFDFGAFKKIMKMPSREKIIFHMLFGASHGTPRIGNNTLLYTTKSFTDSWIKRIL